ncbi:MAG: 50S ribosomal protein L22 [Gammaproteobacteria bacterium]|nr:50S ribosomal protein L22 [Gammaproteobacteria bacterium]MYC25474.1 50S ribosomal protein L22 [Gammaproteobacteria bacterium]
MRVQAVARGLRVSPQKARLVADQIRGRNIHEALSILEHDVQKSAKLVKKVLDSAVSNAEQNLDADIDELSISEIYVNEGFRMKRFRARARGRGNRILKRTCHITIAVSDHLDDE